MTDTRPPLIPLATALAQIDQAIVPVHEQESVPLLQAHRRISAQTLTARQDSPPYTNAAMDGYALRAVDIAPRGATRLCCVGQALAGHAYPHPLKAGECVRIMTGACLPQGADTVVMQEVVTRHDDQVSIPAPPRPGEHVRRQGEEFQATDPVCMPGRCLNSADLGLLASQGITELLVWRRVRVALFSSGDELTQAGTARTQAQIYDSNRPLLQAALETLPVVLVAMGTLPDAPAALRERLQHASTQADVIITTGGVSVGEADRMREVLAELGTLHLWRLALKPGKPLAFGQIQHAWFFGLPGNPVSALLTFMLCVRPALLKLAGQGYQHLPRFPAQLTHAWHKKSGREEYPRGVYSRSEAGHLCVRLLNDQDSYRLTSLTQANCLVAVAAATQQLSAQSWVDIILLDHCFCL